jgi:hypothetical protein
MAPEPKKKSPQKDDEADKDKKEEKEDEKPGEDQKDDEKKEEEKKDDVKKESDVKKEAKDGDKKEAKDADKKDEKPADDDKKAKDAAKALANRPGEPEFKLKTDVEKLIFKSDKLAEESVVLNFKIENTSGKRQTFKVKCTSNFMFTIRPPLGFIEKDGKAIIKVTFQAKEIPTPNLHYFALYHMAADEKADRPRALWTSTAVPEGVKRLPCSFEKADGTIWAPEKK